MRRNQAFGYGYNFSYKFDFEMSSPKQPKKFRKLDFPGVVEKVSSYADRVMSTVNAAASVLRILVRANVF